MYGTLANYLYAIKCLMNSKPGFIVFPSLMGSIFLFAHAIRISERF